MIVKPPEEAESRWVVRARSGVEGARVLSEATANAGRRISKGFLKIYLGFIALGFAVILLQSAFAPLVVLAGLWWGLRKWSAAR
jgi:hypothetical protein